jgi:hypothetical protein
MKPLKFCLLGFLLFLPLKPSFSAEDFHNQKRAEVIASIKKEIEKCSMINSHKDRADCQAKVRSQFIGSLQEERLQKMNRIGRSEIVEKSIQDGRRSYDESKGKPLRW